MYKCLITLDLFLLKWSPTDLKLDRARSYLVGQSCVRAFYVNPAVKAQLYLDPRETAILRQESPPYVEHKWAEAYLALNQLESS